MNTFIKTCLIASGLMISNLAVADFDSCMANLSQEQNEQSNLLASEEGGANGGGGDAYVLCAPKFSNDKKLNAAIEIAIDKIEQTSFVDSFKSNLINEIKNLQQRQLIKELPYLIVLGNMGPQGYSGKLNTNEFVALGGYVPEFKAGTPVILSTAKVSRYDEVQLAKLIIHESLHHSLGEAIRRSEDFVIKMTDSIMNPRKITRALMFAAKNNFYPTKNGSSADQFKALIIPKIIARLKADDIYTKNHLRDLNLDSNGSKINPNSETVSSDQLYKAIESELWSVDISWDLNRYDLYTVKYRLASVMYLALSFTQRLNTNPHNMEFNIHLKRMLYKYVMPVLNDLALEINPLNQQFIEVDNYGETLQDFDENVDKCKHPSLKQKLENKFYGTCGDTILMSKYFIFPEEK